MGFKILFLSTLSIHCNVLRLVKPSKLYVRLWKSLHISARIFTISEDCNETIELVHDKEQTFPMSLIVLLLLISCWTPDSCTSGTVDYRKLIYRKLEILIIVRVGIVDCNITMGLLLYASENSKVLHMLARVETTRQLMTGLTDGKSTIRNRKISTAVLHGSSKLLKVSLENDDGAGEESRKMLLQLLLLTKNSWSRGQS
ncbi:hypothetical protein RRG08_023272 [Elysia crispata]|uniref:Uncharacterized protein n=1 Tax=Elysia crispata TaxID=231223 RepID=A0AAE1AQN5_9GAST|nr:hypothetical protein RRG08_023272 [Elysia crispata]